MAEAKRKSTSKQVLDVHKPGKTAASDTSRPLIVTHHQILRDPMVTSEATTPLTETPKPTASVSRESSISPLTAPELPKAIKATYGSVDDPAETSVEQAGEDLAEPVADTEVAADAPIADDVEPTETETSSEQTEASAPETEDAQTEPEPVEEAPVQKPAKPHLEPSAETISDVRKAASEPMPEVEVAKLPGDQTEVEKDVAVEKAEAEVQKLILSKKYFLPIDTVEKKRAERFVAIGILLSLILGLAWLDIALDAGIVHLNSIHPVTHFFSN
jgi:hypothetical protein